MAKPLTIQDIPDDVEQRLEKLSVARGKSLNETVLEILRRAVDPEARRQRLSRYVTWDREDVEEFNRHLAEQRTIDHELWR